MLTSVALAHLEASLRLKGILIGVAVHPHLGQIDCMYLVLACLG